MCATLIFLVYSPVICTVFVTLRYKFKSSVLAHKIRPILVTKGPNCVPLRVFTVFDASLYPTV